MANSLILLDIHTHVPADNASGTFVQWYLLENEEIIPFKKMEISLGLHPWEIKNSEENNLSQFQMIKEKLSSKKFIAIGETGFDRYFRKDLSLDLQEKIFYWHYDLACELNLPMILHIVHAHDQFLKVLKKIQRPKVPMLIHDFRGGSEEIKKYLKYDLLHFSFGKSLLSSDGKSLERFLQLPLSRIHLETDGDHEVSLLQLYQKAKIKTDGNLEKLAMEMQGNAKYLFGSNFN